LVLRAGSSRASAQALPAATEVTVPPSTNAGRGARSILDIGTGIPTRHPPEPARVTPSTDPGHRRLPALLEHHGAGGRDVAGRMAAASELEVPELETEPRGRRNRVVLAAGS
jgi:hypothetical protein